QANGNVMVAWLDGRASATPPPPPSIAPPAYNTTDVYCSMSSDGGATFKPNVRLSEGQSNATTGHSFIDYGDYNTMTSYAGVFFYVWEDNVGTRGMPRTSDMSPNNMHLPLFDIGTKKGTAAMFASAPPPVKPYVAVVDSRFGPTTGGYEVVVSGGDFT